MPGTKSPTTQWTAPCTRFWWVFWLKVHLHSHTGIFVLMLRTTLTISQIHCRDFPNGNIPQLEDMKRPGVQFLLFGYHDLLMTTMSSTVVYPERSGMYTKWIRAMKVRELWLSLLLLVFRRVCDDQCWRIGGQAGALERHDSRCGWGKMAGLYSVKP